MVPSAISYYEKSIHLADSLHNYVIVSRGLAHISWSSFDLEIKKLLALNEELIRKEATIVAHNNLLQEMNASKDKLLSLKGFLKLLSHHSDSLSKEELKMFLLDLDKSLYSSYRFHSRVSVRLPGDGQISTQPEAYC